MYFLLLLAVAVTGLVYILRNGEAKKNIGHGVEGAGAYMSTEQFAQRLETFADMPEYESERNAYLALAYSLRNGTMPKPQGDADAPIYVPTSTALENSVLPPGTEQQAALQSTLQTNRTHPTQPTMSETLRNINVLLYLGAFLVLVSVGIFVGVNFDLLGAGFKFALLIFFTATFYLSGLGMEMKSQRLRPAGRTFIGIGLIALPFCGVVAYTLFNIASPYPIALATSLVALAVYTLTFTLTRHTYINYLVMMSALTSLESGLLVFDFQLPVMAWAAVVMAMIFLVLGRSNVVDGGSFSLGAQLLAPASLFFSFVSWVSGTQSSGELGVILLLASGFYALATVLDRNEVQRQIWVSLGLSLLAAAGIALMSEFGIDRVYWAGLLLALGIAYTSAVRFIPSNLKSSVANVAVIAAALSPLFVYDSAALVNIFLALVAAVCLIQYLWLRVESAALITGITVLLLPLTVLFYWLEASLLTIGIFGFMSYLIIGLSALCLRWYVRSGPFIDRLALGVAAIAWPVGWLLAVLDLSNWLVASSSAILAAFVLLAAYQEKEVSLLALASGLLYVASAQAASMLGIDMAVTLIGTGLLIYGAGFISGIKSTAAADWCRYCGVAGPLLAVILGGNVYLQISSLAVASTLGIVEANLRRSSEVAYVAVAGLVLSFLWFIHESGVTESQVYIQTLAIYFAGVAAHLSFRNLPEQRDMATVAALFLATVPLGLQALGTDGTLRGLALVFLSIFLLLAGLGARYVLVWRWAAAVLVLEVLYQLRHVLYAVPKYVVSLGLGMLLIGIAIVVLLRRNDDN